MDKAIEQAFKRIFKLENIGGRSLYLPPNADALVILEHHITGQKLLIWGRNIVTTAGNVFYGQEVSIGVLGSGTPTNAFTQLYLSTAGPATPGVTDTYATFNSGQQTGKAVTSGYPKTNDGDTDNTGAGITVLTWLHSFLTTDGPYTNIQWSFIAKASASGTDPILNSYKWSAAWSKDASTSAKVFTNHTFLGS